MRNANDFNQPVDSRQQPAGIQSGAAACTLHACFVVFIPERPAHGDGHEVGEADAEALGSRRAVSAPAGVAPPLGH